MKIYTRTGDDGQTGLPDGERLSKDDARLEAIGTIDELNCVLGVVRSEPLPEEIDRLLERIQNELLDAGAELAATKSGGQDGPRIAGGQVESLEAAIDWLSETLAPLGQFILPGGCRAAAELHVARAVCRRAERRLVTLLRTDAAVVGLASHPTRLPAYLNRLGDLLFVLARAVNARAGRSDVPWRGPSPPAPLPQAGEGS